MGKMKDSELMELAFKATYNQRTAVLELLRQLELAPHPLGRIPADVLNAYNLYEDYGRWSERKRELVQHLHRFIEKTEPLQQEMSHAKNELVKKEQREDARDGTEH